MNKLIKILIFLGAFVEDFLIFIGLTLIIAATFTLNRVAGIYSLGFILLIIGLIMARRPPRKE